MKYQIQFNKTDNTCDGSSRNGKSGSFQPDVYRKDQIKQEIIQLTLSLNEWDVDVELTKQKINVLIDSYLELVREK